MSKHDLGEEAYDDDERMSTFALNSATDTNYVASNQERFPWLTFFHLLYLQLAFTMAYWLSQISVTQIPGNKFANGIMYCMSEIVGAFTV